MLTYLDESYVIKKRKPHKELLLIGALFLPTQSSKQHIQNGLKKIKIEHDFVTREGLLKEIKYSKLHSERAYEIALKAVDLFISNYRAFFRVGIIEYDSQDLAEMKKLSGVIVENKVKKAMLYTKIVENLIKNNYNYYGITSGVLLLDNLTRCNGDQFNSVIRKKLISGKKKYLRHFEYIDSAAEENQGLQVCDLLLGAIRNGFFPTRDVFKTMFRKQVFSKLNLPEVKYWKEKHNQGLLESKYPKLFVKFYNVPYRY